MPQSKPLKSVSKKSGQEPGKWGQQHTGDSGDPQKWAGRNGMGTGPVPLSYWYRDNPFTGKHTTRIGYQSEPGKDLRPERGEKKK